jgi:hypothetical protein
MRAAGIRKPSHFAAEKRCKHADNEQRLVA